MGLPIGGLANFAQGIQLIANRTLQPIEPDWAYGVLWSIRVPCRVQLLCGSIRLFRKFISLASSFVFVLLDKESVS
jgi:hypothetical protein